MGVPLYLLFVHAFSEMDVDASDVLIKPPVHFIDECEGVLGLVASRLISQPIVAKGCEEHRVRRLVLLGHRTTVFFHASFLEAEMAFTVSEEEVEERGVDPLADPLVKGGPEVVRRIEDHHVLFVDALNSGGIRVFPLHFRLSCMPYDGGVARVE